MQFVIHVSTIISNEQNQILFVKEKKEAVFNKLNLPGGHLKAGEGLVEGAIRETKEEVGVDAEIEGLVGVYTSVGENHYLHFIFAAKIVSGVPTPDKSEINDIVWYSADEIQQVPDGEVLNAEKLKHVALAHVSGKLGSLDLIKEM